MITGNEPINAVLESWRDENPEVLVCNDKGLTIRQHFAAIAMQGILSNEELRLSLLKDMAIDGTDYYNYIATFSVQNADALIAELNKDQK